jgi:signal transduction histidine kinase
MDSDYLQMMRTRVCFFACFSFFCFTCIGQPIQSPYYQAEKRLTLKDGLTQRHINSSYSDRSGRLWLIGNGIAETYRNRQVETFNFPKEARSKGFNQVIEDNLGRYWFIENYEWYYPFDLQYGLVFNPKTELFTPIQTYLHTTVPIHSVVSDSQGNVFVSSQSGQIYRVDERTHSLRRIATVADRAVKLLHADANMLIACVENNARSDQKLIRLTPDGRVMSEELTNGRFVRSVVVLPQRLFYTYYIAGTQKVGIKEWGGTLEKQFAAASASFVSTAQYVPNFELMVLNLGNELVYLNDRLEPTARFPYPDLLIHHIEPDGKGNLILSTNNGAVIFILKKRVIRTLLRNDDPENINDNYSCRSILKVGNRLIVNTNQRRQSIQLTDGKVTTFPPFKSNGGVDFVLSTCIDPQGRWWFGEDALVRYDPATNRDETVLNLNFVKIWAIAPYKTGLLLGLEKKGMVYFDPKSRQVTRFPGMGSDLSNAIVYDFQVGKDEVLIASEAGLHRLLPNHTFQKVAQPAPAGDCFSISPDPTNPARLWIAANDGIWVYDVKTHQSRPFISEPAFANRKFLSAYATTNGVWASAESGVWQFDNSGNLRKIYSVADGLSSNECNRLAHHQDENGVLYFGGINGVNVLNPADFSKTTQTRFPIRVDTLTVYEGQIISQKRALFKDSLLRLTRDENTVELQLAYEDFRYDCSTNYYYRSDRSASQEWQLLASPKLLLTNVEHGATRIEIRAVSCDNFIEAPIHVITLVRAKPLYAELYFWGIVLVVLGALLGIAVNFATWQLKRRNETLQRKVDEQTRSLKESLALKETLLSVLAHDVRYPVQSFFDLSKKLNYLTQKNDTERLKTLGKEAERKSQKVLWLVDELVYWVKSTNQQWQISREEVEIKALIEQLFESYADEMLAKKLTYSLHTTAAKCQSDQGLLLIVLRNLIFNAISHSQPGSLIDIKVEETNGRWVIEIKNEKQQPTQGETDGLGMGLSLLKPLLAKANLILQTEMVGTTFVAILRL